MSPSLKVLKRSVHDLFNGLGFDVVRLHPATNGHSASEEKELRRLREAPDFSISSTSILGPSLQIISNRAFVYLYDEIIRREIYRFKASDPAPVILDCGANIGVSAIYLKRLYPAARLTCFEPSAPVFAALARNLETFGLVRDTTLLQRGVWNAEAELHFQEDRQSTAGHVVTAANGNAATVRTVRLRDYLDQPVEFLKIDIEGAEDTVVPDIADRLHNVRNIFVELHSRVGEPQTFPNLLQILSANGFRLYLETCSRPSRQPLIERSAHKGMDVLLNVFGSRG